MPTAPTTLNPDACYQALQARDARFDGVFFTGSVSTGRRIAQAGGHHVTR